MDQHVATSGPTRTQRLHAIARTLSLLLGIATCGLAVSAEYPLKSIRFVVPWPPGGGADFLSRVLAQKLSERYGQNVVVDNRPGAGGVIGAELAARAPADGYTWLLATAPTAIAPALHSKLTFDVEKDFAAVGPIASAPYVLAVNPALPVGSVAALIAYAKAHPGQISFSSSGTGSVPHLAGELLNTRAGVQMTHVPYRGTGPALADAIGGQVQMTIANIVPTLPQVKAGKLRALAVTSLQRVKLAPELPTIAESGYPGFEASVWYGIFVPAKTPQALIARLNRDLDQVMNQPDMQPRLSQEGATPLHATPQQFAAYVHGELAKWAEVVRISGAKAD